MNESWVHDTLEPQRSGNFEQNKDHEYNLVNCSQDQNFELRSQDHGQDFEPMTQH